MRATSGTGFTMWPGCSTSAAATYCWWSTVATDAARAPQAKRGCTGTPRRAWTSWRSTRGWTPPSCWSSDAPWAAPWPWTWRRGRSTPAACWASWWRTPSARYPRWGACFSAGCAGCRTSASRASSGPLTRCLG
uniref:Uncharacterized protein n=1 Tax=Ixodes ricinus TaxID=34613 RepID=A0A147BEE4_IXORI